MANVRCLGVLRPRVRLALLMFYYCWLPLAYFATYVPIVVPRLSADDLLRGVLRFVIAVPFLLVAILLGGILSRRQLFLHAVGLALILQFCEVGGALLHLPSFAKSFFWEAPIVFWTVVLLVKTLLLVAVAELGRFVCRRVGQA